MIPRIAISDAGSRRSPPSPGPVTSSSQERLFAPTLVQPPTTTQRLSGLGIDLGPPKEVIEAQARQLATSDLYPDPALSPAPSVSPSSGRRPSTPLPEVDALPPVTAASALSQRDLQQKDHLSEIGIHPLSLPSALAIDSVIPGLGSRAIETGPATSRTQTSNFLGLQSDLRPSLGSQSLTHIPSLSSSSSGKSAGGSSSLLNLTLHQQVLPQVRSPPKRPTNDLYPTKPVDSHPADWPSRPETKVERRPRVFGFTEMQPHHSQYHQHHHHHGSSSSGRSRVARFDIGGGSAQSSPGSSSSSRDGSPERYGGLEMLPRKKQAQSFAFFEDAKRETESSSPSYTPSAGSYSGTLVTAASSPNIVDSASASMAKSNGISPAVGTTTNVVRRSSLDRLPSGVARIHRLASKQPKQSTLAERIVQRNGSDVATTLKLDLQSIRSEQHSSLNHSSDRAAPATLSPIIRKKSGEILKPSLKSSSSYTDVASAASTLSSAPSTPKFKSVQFDTKLEKIKLFRNDQKPEIVSREGTPNDYDTSENEYPFFSTDDEDEKKQLEIRLPNFPTLTHSQDEPIFVESIYLSEDRKSLKGSIRVKNLAFEKRVVVRYTVDWWQTVNEVAATYKETLASGQHDRFIFTVKLSDFVNLDEKTMFLALRYNVGADGEEHWDNNQGQNYQVNFVKVKSSSTPTLVAKRGAKVLPAGMGKALGSSQWNVKGQEQDRMADLKAKLDRLSAGDSAIRRSPRVSSSPGLRSPGPRSPNAEGPLSPLAGRYSFESALRSDKQRRSSPPGGDRSLPLVAVKPSQDFYSPRLSLMTLPTAPSGLPMYGGPPEIVESIATPSSASTIQPARDYFEGTPAVPVAKPEQTVRKNVRTSEEIYRDSPPSVSNSVSSLSSSIEDAPESPPNQPPTNFVVDTKSEFFSHSYNTLIRQMCFATSSTTDAPPTRPRRTSSAPALHGLDGRLEHKNLPSHVEYAIPTVEVASLPTKKPGKRCSPVQTPIPSPRHSAVLG